jgi:sugar phosphate isomerase/epimerase
VLLPHTGVSRRNLLRCLPIFAIGGSRLALGQQSPKQPDLHFPTEPRARLAVTSWPFRAYIQSPTNRHTESSKPGMDLKDFAAMVVKRFDVHNINPLADHFSSTDRAYLETFREGIEKAGAHIVDLGLGGKSFYDLDASKRKAAIDYGRQWIDIATVIGSPSVRQHVSGPRGATPDVKLAAESLGELAEYGAKRNIIVNLENDNAVAEDPFFLVSVIRKVNTPYLRALPDFGNSRATYDPAKNQEAVALMLKYANNMCHVKDSVHSAAGKVLTVDLGRMFAIAKQNSYKGYFSMEFDVDSNDPFQGTQKLINETLKYLS